MPGSYPIGVAAAAVVSCICVVLQITGMNPVVCVCRSSDGDLADESVNVEPPVRILNVS